MSNKLFLSLSWVEFILTIYGSILYQLPFFSFGKNSEEIYPITKAIFQSVLSQSHRWATRTTGNIVAIVRAFSGFNCRNVASISILQYPQRRQSNMTISMSPWQWKFYTAFLAIQYTCIYEKNCVNFRYENVIIKLVQLIQFMWAFLLSKHVRHVRQWFYHTQRYKNYACSSLVPFPGLHRLPWSFNKPF